MQCDIQKLLLSMLSKHLSRLAIISLLHNCLKDSEEPRENVNFTLYQPPIHCFLVLWETSFSNALFQVCWEMYPSVRLGRFMKALSQVPLWVPSAAVIGQFHWQLPSCFQL